MEPVGGQAVSSCQNGLSMVVSRWGIELPTLLMCTSAAATSACVSEWGWIFGLECQLCPCPHVLVGTAQANMQGIGDCCVAALGCCHAPCFVDVC